MLQEIFAAGGYRTAAVVANPVVAPSTGLTRGFHRYRQPGRLWLFGTLPLSLVMKFRAAPLMATQLVAELTGLERDAPASEIVDHALREVDRAKGQPLYLFLNFVDTHLPNPPPRNGV